MCDRDMERKLDSSHVLLRVNPSIMRIHPEFIKAALERGARQTAHKNCLVRKSLHRGDNFQESSRFN